MQERRFAGRNVHEVGLAEPQNTPARAQPKESVIVLDDLHDRVGTKSLLRSKAHDATMAITAEAASCRTNPQGALAVQVKCANGLAGQTIGERVQNLGAGFHANKSAGHGADPQGAAGFLHEPGYRPASNALLDFDEGTVLIMRQSPGRSSCPQAIALIFGQSGYKG